MRRGVRTRNMRTGRDISRVEIWGWQLRRALRGLIRYRHIYYSTSCRHRVHQHCRSWVSVEGGSKVPDTCKFCGARCICSCHIEHEY